jgi:predicted RND superfamily exporter protein
MNATSYIVQRPVVVLVIVLLVTLAAGLSASRVRFESAIEVWFLESDPALVTYDEFTEQFAADELVLMAFRADVFSEATFAALARLTEQVAAAPYVHRVRTLLDFDLDPVLPFGEENGQGYEVESGGIGTDWRYRKAEAASNALVTPALVAADGKTAALVIEIERTGNTVEGKRALVEALDDIIAAEMARSGLSIHITGTPVLDHRALVLNDRDLAGVYPLIVPLVFLICWITFGSFRIAIIPILVVAGAAAIAFGFMGLFGLKTTLLSSAMLPLFLAIGVADAVHLLAEYQRHRVGGESPSSAIGVTLEHLWQPCLFTSITTAAGLSALLVSDLRPVREFGITAAVGVLAAFFITMTLVPALLCLFGRRMSVGAPPSASWMAVLVRRFVSPPRFVSRFVLIGGLLIGLLSLASAMRIEVGVNPMSWFRSDDPFRQATRLADSELGGATAVEFLVRAPVGDLDEPAMLTMLDDFERWVERSTSVSGCISVVELLKEATRTLSEGEDRHARLPGVSALTSSLLAVLQSRGELERWLSEDRSMGRISCRIPLGKAADLGVELTRVNAEIDSRFAATGLKVEPTGYGVLMVQMEDHLVRSQLLSITIAFLVVLLMLALLIRSFALGLTAMLPNLLPVLVGLGLMPVLGISLNPGTVMVAAVALGIVVDDTAHLLVAMRRHLNAGQELEVALRNAISDVGSPVVLTSMILIASMGMLMLGSFAPGIHFGAVATLVTLAALVADLWLLPQLLNRLPVERWVRSKKPLMDIHTSTGGQIRNAGGQS